MGWCKDSTCPARRHLSIDVVQKHFAITERHLLLFLVRLLFCRNLATVIGQGTAQKELDLTINTAQVIVGPLPEGREDFGV